MEFRPQPSMKFEALTDESGTAFFIGRSKSIHEKYGQEGALLLGTLSEEENYGKPVYLDAIAPHVVFIVGARGSGKSYSLGVIAEELVFKNPNVASIIIDPIGIYWSMKYPNQDEKEVDALIRMGLMPKGVDHVKVFVPYGVKDQLPKGTYDATFALRPADLTVDDWCLTFDIDRFSPTGLLLEKVIQKVKEGYETVDGKRVKPKPETYSLRDIIHCLQNDKELSSSKKGFKADSRRALISRFEAADGWGIFTEEGTSLIELARQGEISVVDVSFLEENVTSLVIGILARKILQARKLAARQSSMKKFAEIDELEANIPPVWLFIDEAHTLIPSGGKKTPATDPLTEYVKQGRRPGCSLVFATQQPGAIDTHVLSQLDILMCHKLVFDDDIKAVMKRMPTQVPPEYKNPRFIKTLPIGHCIVSDRSDSTSRAFVLKVRPRFSQHEGREIRSIDTETPMEESEVFEALVKMIKKHIADRKRIHESTLKEIVNTINKRYNTKIDPSVVISRLLDEGYVSEEGYIALETEEKVEEVLEESVVKKKSPSEKFLVFSPLISEKQAYSIIDKLRKRKLLGLFGDEEHVTRYYLEYWPIYKVSYKLFEKGGFKRSVCYVDGITGELLYLDNGKLGHTSGLAQFAKLDRNQRGVIIALMKGKKASAKALAAAIGVTDTTARMKAEELVERGIVRWEKASHGKTYYLAKKFDLPNKITLLPFTGLETYLTVQEVSEGKRIDPKVGVEYVSDVPEIFGETKIEDVTTIFAPVYVFELSSGGKKRKLGVNTLTGEVVKIRD